MKAGSLLPGRKIVSERIRENRERYCDALEAADRAWEVGQYDVSQLAELLEELLLAQLSERVTDEPTGVQ
jgi:hypothetical protein